MHLNARRLVRITKGDFSKMFDGLDLIIVGAIAIVIIMWGPAKIPEFARALGRAQGEFKKAQKEFSDAATAESSAVTANTIVAAPKLASAIKTKDEMLIETAQKLGIPTDGKTREQISEEISVKVKWLGAD